jgi:hypothetical protein
MARQEVTIYEALKARLKRAPTLDEIRAAGRRPHQRRRP